MKAILEWRGIKVEYMKAKEADPEADTVALAQRPWDAPDLEALGLDLNIKWDEEDDDYVEKPESAALPTWSAVEIHLALNQPVPSARTIEDLVRVGRILGDREGTGPMDDAQVAGYMRRSHEVGQRTGLARGREIGRAQGVAEGLASAASAILGGRGVPLPDGFEQRLAARTVAPDVLLEAAQRCSTAADFWERV